MKRSWNLRPWFVGWFVICVGMASNSRMAINASTQFIDRAITNPPLLVGLSALAYVTQYWCRKRVAAAIFLLRSARDRRKEPKSAATGSLGLEDLMPIEIASFAREFGIDPTSDVDLVERLITDVLEQKPPNGWELVRTPVGLRFIDVDSGELHQSHPGVDTVTDELRATALQRHPNDVVVGIWKTSSINDDKIFKKFLKEETETETFLASTMRSFKNVLRHSTRPDILNEASSLSRIRSQSSR